MNRPVHIVAIAARTPVGLSAEGTAAAIRARISRLMLHPVLVDAAGDHLRCAPDSQLKPSLEGVERLVQLAGSALDELFSKQVTRGAVPVLVSVAEPRP